MKSILRVAPVLLLLSACHKEAPAPVYEAVPVVRRDIVVTTEASGAINADTVVEVKSKASGEILQLNAATGDLIKRGTLIAQIDQRIPANDVRQAEAALAVDSAQLANAQSQYDRQKELYAARAVTEQELETAQLAVKVANASVVRDAIALQNAKIAFGDTQVLAPMTGTVMALDVQRGTVISSPTNSASGGTILLTMADLSLVQVRTWVDETDVGKLRPGQQATIVVAAYPNRPFQGEVRKIEPQADTIQNVTMFPVDIRIDNHGGLLKPGMNADVNIMVGQRLNVEAVPYAALRTERDVASAGMVLGIAPDALQQMLQQARETFNKSMAQNSDTGAQGQLPAGTGAAAPERGRGAADSGGSGGRPGGASGAMEGARGGNRGGENGGGGARGGFGGGRNGGGPGGGGGGFGGGRGGGRGGASIDPTAGGRYVVFVRKNGQPEPVYVQTGLTDMDYAEIKAGALSVGDSVLLLPSESMIQSQQQFQDRMRRFSGLPGQTQKSTNSTSTSNSTNSGRRSGGGRS